MYDKKVLMYIKSELFMRLMGPLGHLNFQKKSLFINCYTVLFVMVGLNIFIHVLTNSAKFKKKLTKIKTFA